MNGAVREKRIYATLANTKASRKVFRMPTSTPKTLRSSEKIFVKTNFSYVGVKFSCTSEHCRMHGLIFAYPINHTGISFVLPMSLQGILRTRITS